MGNDDQKVVTFDLCIAVQIYLSAESFEEAKDSLGLICSFFNELSELYLGCFFFFSFGKKNY